MQGNTVDRFIAGSVSVLKWVIILLLVVLLLTVIAATVTLTLSIVGALLSPGTLERLYEPDVLFAVFEAVFVVIIGVELFETIVVYLTDNRIHVESILLVAITAVARKVIVLDVGKYDPVTLVGVAALAIALTTGYFLVRRSSRDESAATESAGSAE